MFLFYINVKLSESELAEFLNKQNSVNSLILQILILLPLTLKKTFHQLRAFIFVDAAGY
jgi:hypothetical protein